MHRWREGRAAVGQYGDVEIPHVGVAHRRGDAAAGLGDFLVTCAGVTHRITVADLLP